MKKNSLTLSQTSYSFTQTSYSFTLIELLVATFIFMILITIGMAAMTVMWHSKSKLSGSKTIQEAGRLSMEMMANEVKKANGEESTYKKFIIEDSGASLEVKQNVKKVFRLEDSSGNQQDIDCPTGDTCHVAVNIDNTSWSQLTSSDVNVTKLEFSGQDGQPQTGDYIEPYVTIEMAVQTTNQTDVNKKANAVFRTTVMTRSQYAGIQSGVLPYVFLADDDTGGSGGMTCMWDKSLTNHSCSTNHYLKGSDIANDGMFIYETDVVDHGGESDGRDAWVAQWYPKFLDISKWLKIQSSESGWNKGNGIAVDAQYLYVVNGLDDGHYLRRYDKYNFGSTIDTDGRIYNADRSQNITLNGVSGMTSDGVYLYISYGSKIAKIDARNDDPKKWLLVKSVTSATENGASGIKFDAINSKLWAVKRNNFICRYDIDPSEPGGANDLANKVCRTTALVNGTSPIKGGDGITSDGEFIYITQHDGSWTAKVENINDVPANWHLVKKIHSGDNHQYSGYDIDTGINWKYEWQLK